MLTAERGGLFCFFPPSFLSLSILRFSPLSCQTLTEASARHLKDDDHTDESSSLLGPGRNGSLGRSTEQQMKIIKAVLYAVQVFYSFFIM